MALDGGRTAQCLPATAAPRPLHKVLLRACPCTLMEVAGGKVLCQPTGVTWYTHVIAAHGTTEHQLPTIHSTCARAHLKLAPQATAGGPGPMRASACARTHTHTMQQCKERDFLNKNSCTCSVVNE